EKFAPGQIIVEIRLLGQKSDFAVHGDIFNRTAANTRGPCGRKDQAHQELERSSFSRAVGAEESEDFALFDLKRQVIERPAQAFTPETGRIVLGQPEDFDCWCSHGSIIINFFEFLRSCQSQGVASGDTGVWEARPLL